MAKREFLMLSHTYDEAKHSPAGWMVSEKKDGLRIWWDGGISRGVPVREVPYSNTLKDARYVDQNIVATGLWSRNAKVIRAPEWWLNQLPPIPLDGEAWAGHRKWEVTSSIVKDIIPDDRAWRDIKFWVFDSPPFDEVFKPGIIDNEHHYKIIDDDVLKWALDRADKVGLVFPNNYQFEFVHSWLIKNLVENDTVRMLRQVCLPHNTQVAKQLLSEKMEEVTSVGAEGLMIRKMESYWRPERMWNLLKIKKWYDAEGTVIGYIWGEKTTRGSKLLGLMGAAIVEWEGKVFKVSGFDLGERVITFEGGNSAADVGRINPGKEVADNLVNPRFPRGTRITFRYRELTAIGIPKSANYHRKYVSQ